MKKIFISLIFSSIIINSLCQNKDFKKPDYKGIEKIIVNKESGFFYPDFLKRYKKSDTTLTLQDFRILYYGFLFNESYSVYGSSNYQDSINLVLGKDSLIREDFFQIIYYERLILDEYPFNLRDLNVLLYSYLQIGDTLSAIEADFKLNMIIQAILSTGDGKKEKTAWHVISISHEYDILGALGFQFGGSQTLTKNGCDYLEIADNDYGIKGFYFDVNMILNKQRDLFK
jgi:hypothetical protein